MKFTVEHARKVARELYGDLPQRCSPVCEVCDVIGDDWEYNVNKVLDALRVLENEE